MSTSPLPCWAPPPPRPVLTGYEVHAWRAFLDLAASRLADMETVLSADELTRADRFRFERDRRRFILSRGALRHILARYLGVQPGGLRFRYDAHGKPSVSIGRGAPSLRFNVSHSHDMALFAVTRGRRIGIDLEWIKAAFPIDEVAERFFSPREVAALKALPEERRLEGFFTCWTRKEAYLKARGDGLSHPLDCFDVSLDPGHPAALLCTRDDPSEARRWTIRGIFPGHGYVAAVAVEGHDWRLAHWQWCGAART